MMGLFPLLPVANPPHLGASKNWGNAGAVMADPLTPLGKTAGTAAQRQRI
jgi:hypothetical protein